METLVLPPPSLHASIDAASPLLKPARRERLLPVTTTQDPKISWGRRGHHGSWLDTLTCASIMFLAPCLVVFYWISLSSFRGSLSDASASMISIGVVDFFSKYGPRPTLKTNIFYASWLLFQAALYQFLPSQLSNGQLTPAGHLLSYRTNGLLAWFVTHALFVAGSLLSFINPAILAQNWEGLLVAANIFGFTLSGFAYVKAHLFPCHEADRKFSGSRLYDMFMGIELNPRFGKYFDFKLFTNGRPGIIAWTLIDLSFIAYQYQVHGFVTKSILVSTALHSIYVIDFFINEDWYLRTIDICHDHFGFYLAWGSIVWLPSMYTLQTQYLARNPVVLSIIQASGILATGVIGYLIFRCVNHQKDLARRTKGNCTLWGSPAEIIRVKYRTKDGLEHDSMLLCSGWWGLARHVNYLGDLILSYSMCATCGFENLLPWTYGIFMTVLLIHRCWRDEERCSAKYGAGWEEYCKKVPWIIIPGIY